MDRSATRLSASTPTVRRSTVLAQVAEGVLVHESAFIRSNAVVVQGRTGVLLVDPGITSDELATLAGDLRDLGRPVVAGFSTHPHWDHVLWHADLGPARRYGTARCAARLRDVLSLPDWPARVAGMLPPDIGDQVPLDHLFGRVTGLDAGTTRVPWDGPGVRVVEHDAHAAGHAALLVEERGVLVAGDLLSDVLVPMLDLGAADPVGDHLAALEVLEGMADDVDVVVPGHGSVGGPGQLRARIDQDRAYLHALRDGTDPDDPRIGPSAGEGWDWVAGVHERQRDQLAQRAERDGTPA
jgi:glyoxylase-like metal-dependent hydrolase (beta-lactamase superfamily II)